MTITTLVAETDFYAGTTHTPWEMYIGMVATVALFSTVVLAIRWEGDVKPGEAKPGDSQLTLAKCVLAFWLIGPPCWFFLEYFYIYKISGDFAHFDHFKYGQEQAAKIWAGTLAFLYAVNKLHSPSK